MPAGLRPSYQQVSDVSQPTDPGQPQRQCSAPFTLTRRQIAYVTDLDIRVELGLPRCSEATRTGFSSSARLPLLLVFHQCSFRLHLRR